MKTLTLTQPWAQLVAIGAKRLETRSWRTEYQGPLAIHAAKGFPGEAVLTCASRPFRVPLEVAGYRLVRGADLRNPWDLPLGVVVAVGYLVGCFQVDPDGMTHAWHHWAVGRRIVREIQVPPEEPERSFGNYEPGRYAWLIEDVRRLREPIPAKGALGLWEWGPPADLKELFVS